jgi:prepilin-type N-terminal cleavage/methylation domain-containing protein
MRRSRGFTLMELMLALGIFGLVTATLYGTFSRTLSSKAIAEEHAEITRTGRAAVNRMADEIASAFYPRQSGVPAIFRVLLGGTDALPLDSLTFTALTSRPAGLDAYGTDQRYLVYFFAREKNGRGERRTTTDGDGTSATQRENTIASGSQPKRADIFADDADDYFAAFGPTPVPPLGTSPHRLLRREATMIDDRAIDQARATVFVEDVASLSFRFYDGREWLDTWDSEEHNARLPRAVSIDLALYDPEGEMHHFTTAVDLPLSDHIPSFAGDASPGAKGSPKPAKSPLGFGR